MIYKQGTIEREILASLKSETKFTVTATAFGIFFSLSLQRTDTLFGTEERGNLKADIPCYAETKAH